MGKNNEKKSINLLALFISSIVLMTLFIYITDIFFNLISDLENGETVTLSSFLLGTSRNWNSFWMHQLKTFPFGIFCAVAGWIYFKYIQK